MKLAAHAYDSTPPAQYRTTPHPGHDHRVPNPVTSGVVQNGHTVSAAGVTFARLLRSDGRRMNRKSCTASTMANIGAAMRQIHAPIRKSAPAGTRQNRIDSDTQAESPLNSSRRRNRELLCGLRPHSTHFQCRQNPTGRSGTPQTCPMSNVRTATARRCARQLTQ